MPTLLIDAEKEHYFNIKGTSGRVHEILKASGVPPLADRPLDVSHAGRPAAGGTHVVRRRKESLTYADGMLYTLSERLAVGLVKATPTGHEVVSRFELAPQGKAPSWAHPVVCGGRLYLRHGEILYVYNVDK